MFAHLIRESSAEKSRIRLACLVIFTSLLVACAHETQPPVNVDAGRVLEAQTGLASYYHPSLDGEETAGGVTFDSDALMAAHPTYPLGTLVRVTNLEGEGSVEVRIADRGPTDGNRAEGVIIDLSRAAAEKIGMVKEGRTRVKIEVVEWGQDKRK